MEQRDSESKGFVQMVKELPPLLYQKFLLRMLGAVGVLAISAILSVVLHSTNYLLGLLIALYLLYLSMDIVWSYAGGKTSARKIIIIRASRLLGSNHIKIVGRDLDMPEGSEESIVKFNLRTNKRDSSLLTANTVMLIYCTATSVEPVAWEIIGLEP